MDLQPLFHEKIISIEELTPGYEDHASDVWLVKTAHQEVIVRSSGVIGQEDGAFWGGCRHVFGLNPRNVYSLEAVNNALYPLSDIRIPRVIGKGFIDREYVIVEKLEGETLHSFKGPREMLVDLGRGLAQIHRKEFHHTGNPLGTFRIDLQDFHDHLIRSMKTIIDEYYADDDKIRAFFPQAANMLKSIPAPASSSFIMVDMDPTQFLTDGKGITGLVDTEAYAVGPRELDFIALEYVLDQANADDFADGYCSVLDMPDLSRCRLPYRYLYRLMEIQGCEDLDTWLNHPILFH